MLRTCLVLHLLLGCGASYAQQSADSAPSIATKYLSVSECVDDRDAFLNLDFWTFDQDPVQGVRSVASIPGCELVAADLVSDYHQALRENGEPVIVDHPAGTFTMSENGEVGLLYWHEGQMRAFEEQTDRAIELFRLSLKPEERSIGGWNEYAMASIAFLQGNIEELQKQRELMANATMPNPINLGVVDGLVACFEESYSEAYGSTECNRRPGFDQTESKD